MNQNPNVIVAVQDLAPESSEEEVRQAVQYLVKTYMNMRSLDFVRQIMGMSRRSLAQGTRPTMAVISSHGGAKGKGKSAMLGSFDAMTCFFCSKEGHCATNCTSIDIAPEDGDPTTKEVLVNFKGNNKIIVWHYCASCLGWRHHTTSEHDDNLEENAEKNNAVNSVLEIMDSGNDEL